MAKSPSASEMSQCPGIAAATVLGLPGFLTAKAGCGKTFLRSPPRVVFRFGGETFAPDAVVLSPAERPQASSCIVHGLWRY
jgi:hypothetical protein